MSPSDSEIGNIRPLPEAKDTIAVAVQQSDGKASTPKVVAGGKGAVARQILEIAFQNGIKVREDSDLAELLSVVDVDSEIPLDAFAAVAEILTYVYQLNSSMGPEAEMSENERGSDRMDPAELTKMWSAPVDSENE
jgi:flagellar biosynthesis protein